jgi:hypothetical protein
MIRSIAQHGLISSGVQMKNLASSPSLSMSWVE